MIVKFILEIIDAATACPSKSFAIELPDPSVISSLLEDEGFDARCVYELDAHEATRISAHFGFSVGESASAILRPRHWLDDLPYQVHTNRELALMLDGVKPFAAFAGEYPPLTDVSVIPERLLDRYVAAGRFVKREYVGMKVFRGHRTRRVLYARPDEAWRIDAYILLLHTGEVTGWNESLERMEGFLLGYEEWQADAYIRAAKARTGASQQNTS
ncbi:hypothetical protein [Burkholderia sp. PAMC 26561]|uniref:hypothetical protein n=1 Tax=Burkholderia sp. PAMC 26561 TaxID=1795043 RepID=UPI00076B3890|nr:hypothetical protein [Burkholderia sp. PAMC 26561]AME28591.1 hypothetical protein AXG89_32885 [Burkholderia sp. PAMC 26561]